MHTVNFKCGHCGQVMAVGRDNLGQQVRCPHCQQVVLAPTSESPAPTPAAPSPFGNLHEHEDIFVQKRDTDDALFGRAESPRLEIPRDPEPSLPTIGYNGPPPAELPLETLPPEPAPMPSPVSHPTPFFNESPTFVNESPPTEMPHWSPPVSRPEAVQDQAPSAPMRSRERKEGFVSMAFLLMIFTPTVLWALGATGIAFWLYGKAMEGQNTPQRSPFDEMIDDGDNPGVRKDKVKIRAKMQTTEKFATSSLPERRKTTIGEPIVVGDLEVTPLGVSRRAVFLVTANAPDQPHERPHDSLVLDLKFKNLSTEYAFAPLDDYFDRQYKGIGLPPLTLIQAGDRTIYGGSHQWIDVTKPKAPTRQFPYQRKQATSILAPGETATGYVCTDGNNEKTAEFLFGNKEKKEEPYRGPMLWRVHVRRGPHEHRGRVLSATTVIGVEFTDKEIIDQRGRKDF